jgi:hypothetical protein
MITDTGQESEEGPTADPIHPCPSRQLISINLQSP